MSIDFKDSIVLITSKDLDNHHFGTGFVIHHENQVTYVLTCAHVVKDVGDTENISISGQTPTVIASGEDQNIDAAILSVVGMFDKPTLQLCISGSTGDAFTTAGFQLFDQGFLLRPIQGNLGAEVDLEFRDQAKRIPAWDLKIGDPDFDLQPGYSGSPVVDKETGCVFGVVSYKLGAKKGLAISVEAIRKIWLNMPFELSEKDQGQTSKVSSVQSPFSELKRKTLEETLADLCKKYQAAYTQLRSSLSAVDKITLQNQINQLEQEIREVEKSLSQQ